MLKTTTTTTFLGCDSIEINLVVFIVVVVVVAVVACAAVGNFF